MLLCLNFYARVLVVTMLLLLLCGDIEMNPRPCIGIQTTLIVTFKCMHVRKKICECGYVFHNKVILYGMNVDYYRTLQFWLAQPNI